MTDANTPQPTDTGLLAALQAAAQPAGQPAVVTAAVTDPANPGNGPAAEPAPPAPPSPPIQFADPPAPVVKTVEQALMERGLHPSQQAPAPVAQPEPERSVMVGDMRLVERGSEIVLESVGSQQVPQTPYPRNERQMTRLEQELAAGQRRVAHHKEMQSKRHLLAARPSAAELAAQGQNTPVFRPGDTIESGRMQGGTVFPQAHVFGGEPPRQ